MRCFLFSFLLIEEPFPRQKENCYDLLYLSKHSIISVPTTMNELLLVEDFFTVHTKEAQPINHHSTRACFHMFLFFSCSNQLKHDMKPQKITARNLTLRMVLRFGFRLNTKNSSEPFSCTSRSINHRFSKQNYNNKLMPKSPKKATKRECETNLGQFASSREFDSHV